MDSSFLTLEKDRSTSSPVNRICRESRKEHSMAAFTGTKAENMPMKLNTAWIGDFKKKGET